MLSHALIALVGMVGATQAQPSQPTQVVFPPSSWVILADSSGPSVLHQCSRPVPTVSAFWRPDSAMIPKLDSALRPAVKQGLDALHLHSQPTHSMLYYRQYVGVVIGFHRYIYINGFELLKEERERSTWRREASIVCDGWYGYFGALYDVQTGKISEFHFNGIG